jgi:hypothetical protein
VVCFPEEGGDGGKAVCEAIRRTDVLFPGVGVEARGEDVLRLNVACSMGGGGDRPLLEGTGVAWLLLTERGTDPEVVLVLTMELGGDPDENVLSGETGRVDVEFDIEVDLLNPGEPGRLAGRIWEPEVA